MLINLFPATDTIRAADLRSGDTILVIGPWLISLMTLTNVREYDESIYADHQAIDIYEATNLEGIGPFTSTFRSIFDLDDEVMVIRGN